MKWIDVYVDGVIELANSCDVFEIYNTFNIDINKLNKDSFVLHGNDSLYARDYFENEVVFIRNDLEYKYTKFILAHELGHAMLHCDLQEASYNSSLINKGKLERQADYFALKLLGITLDPVQYEGLTLEQIASDLCISKASLKEVMV